MERLRTAQLGVERCVQKNRGLPIIRGDYHRELFRDSSAAPLMTACKAITKQRVVTSDAIVRLELMGRRIIHDLMDLYWDGIGSADGIPVSGIARKVYNLMSPNYRRVFEAEIDSGRFPARYCQLQLITDSICGMTDTFACSFHRQLTNG